MIFRPLLLFVCLLCAGGVSGAEVRTWTDIKGRQVKAAFLKREGASVYLELSDGKSVTAKFDNLSKEDQDYIDDLTYVPCDVTVKCKRKGLFDFVYEEVGSSPAATMRDSVTFSLVEEQDGQAAEAGGDSRWKIESVNVVGKVLLPQKEGGAKKLETKGKFVLVAYEVRNMSKAPVRQVPPPILFDQGGCPATQFEREDVSLRDYVPESVLLAGADTLRPGMPQTFWTYYEIPADSVPALVEVFPLKTAGSSSGQADLKGKQIFLSKDAAKLAGVRRPAAGGEPASAGGGAGDAKPAADTPAPAVALPGDKKLLILLDARRTKQSGDTKSDLVKVRSHTYQVDARVMSSDVKQVSTVVKVFFIGQTADRRNVVVDRQEREAVLEQNKGWSESFTSKEVREHRSYFYYYDYLNNSRKMISGAELSGVIVQVWAGGQRVKSISKGDPSLKKFEDSPDVVKELGEMKEDEGI